MNDTPPHTEPPHPGDADGTPDGAEGAAPHRDELTDADRARDARVADLAERRRMGLSAIVFALATFVSRIAGTVREILTSAIFGIGTQASAFTVAFQIPNLIRALVADSALSGAFVPVFTELRERDEHERAWRLAGTLASLIVVVLGPLTLLAGIFAPEVVAVFVSKATLGAEGFQLAVNLTRILLPIVILFALNGLVVGILNAHDKFAIPAMAPIAWNVVIIVSLGVGAAFAPSSWVIYIYAIGVVIGTLVQFLIPLPQMFGLGGNFRPHFDIRDPRVRQVLLLMLPVTISLGLINLQQLIDTLISTHVPASWFPSGVTTDSGPSILDKAFRVYMLPQGIFSVGITTVVFPVLARHAARGDDEGFLEHFGRALRQIMLTLIPSTFFLIVFAQPVVQVLNQRGNFTHAHTLVVSEALMGFSVGLVLNGATLLTIRAFFARKLTWIPSAISVLTLVANVFFDLLLYKPMGVTGIALATSLVNVVGFATMYILLRRRIGRLDTRRTLAVTIKAVIASVAAAAIAWPVYYGLSQLTIPSTPNGFVIFIALTAATVLFGAIYLAAAVVTGVATRDEIRAMLRRRPRT